MRWLLVAMTTLASLTWASSVSAGPEPGGRVLLDAHNCYPYNGRWSERIDRALGTGTPLAIEQDLVWFVDPLTHVGRSLVAHDDQGKPNLGLAGTEPTLKQYFFERIRPVVEVALRENRRDEWPLITLNLDLKTEEPEHLAAVWSVLSEYRAWLTTAPRRARLEDVAPLTVGPVLVLTGESDAQQKAFHDDLRTGQPLLVFGAARPLVAQSGTDASARTRRSEELPTLTPGARTNYHRWWNNPWSVVELGGQTKAGAWTADDASRLRALVRAAHDAGLWIRFYTLNGHDPGDESGGWSAGYNFGALDAARLRWRAAIDAGVDFVAVDQYEAFSETLRERRTATIIELEGDLTRADYKRLFERTFTVPPGTRRIQATLTYSGTDAGTVIDLGLRGPDGFRGWSGGGQQTVAVSALSASYAYAPGLITPGEWAVVLGIPNIAAERADHYRIDLQLSATELPARETFRTAAGWYVGDLHAHSGHSDGKIQRESVRSGAPPFRVFEAARDAGLDFVSLSDHNTPSHWVDVDRLQPAYAPMVLLHAREITTYRGHANATGERRFNDFRLGSGVTVADVLRGPHDDGAFISINHPALPDCMGCWWSDLDAKTVAQFDGVEVVNGDGRDLEGWRVWAGLLNRGYRVTAVGGSDEHTPEEITDKKIGRPATVVYATSLSEPALVAGLKAGRVYIRTAGPGGPTLEFFATAAGRRIDMGQQAPPGAVRLTARIGGAAGDALTWIRNGEPLGTSTIRDATDLTRDVVAKAGDWFSLLVNGPSGPTLMANAIYIAR